jgi:hypothetical protein
MKKRMIGVMEEHCRIINDLEAGTPSLFRDSTSSPIQQFRRGNAQSFFRDAGEKEEHDRSQANNGSS